MNKYTIAHGMVKDSMMMISFMTRMANCHDIAQNSASKGPTTDPRRVSEPARGAASYGAINDRKHVDFGYEPN